ncbi:MAG TPA: rhodanese-like domain-containing protein [Bacteroidia bacterium]|nr:rhodanese-like domain-containing protein [Bacteroidia bacterium]
MPETINFPKECIEAEELKHAILNHKKIQIIDVRSKEEFKQQNIPNAINIALTELKAHINSLDKQYEFVTVCGNGGGRSSEASKLLLELGFNAKWLCGGTLGWLKIQEDQSVQRYGLFNPLNK